MGEAGDERVGGVMSHSASRVTLSDRAPLLFNFACTIEVQREGVNDDYEDDGRGVDQDAFGGCAEARAGSHSLLRLRVDGAITPNGVECVNTKW